MVSLIEQFHSIGCVHNDLKLDNICVGLPNIEDNLTQLKIIDFGIATTYAKRSSLFKIPANDSEHID